MRTRETITMSFQIIHRNTEPRTDCRGCTQRTCSDPTSDKGMVHVCWGRLNGLITTLNANDPLADALLDADPKHPERSVVTAMRE